MITYNIKNKLNLMYAVTLLAVAMLLPMSYMAQDAPTIPYFISSAPQQDSPYGLPSAFGVAPGCHLTGCHPAPARHPDSPQLNATVDGTNVTLTWNIPNDGGSPIKNYIFNGLTSSSGPYWIKISDISADVRGVMFACNESLSCSMTTSTGTGNIIIAQITGLAPNQSHGFQVLAQNYVGASASNNVWITTTVSEIPDPPRNLAADIGDKKITLMWDAPLDNGGSPITEYVIWGRIGNMNPFSVVKMIPGSETSVTVDTVNGMPYQFVAYAKNSVNTSSASNIVKAVSTSLP